MNNAVLFLIFNRPDTTQRVFDAIRKAKPPRLYIAADGVRKHKPNDIELCSQVRAIVNKIDWPCNVDYLYRDNNLGCKDAVCSGIDWFFTHEESGIILEDDCLPVQEFFEFCDILLDKYRLVDKVYTISGINIFGQNVASNSYYFSRYSSIWGWATWRNRWEAYNLDIKNRKKINNLLGGKFYPRHFQKHIDFSLDLVDAKITNTWDYQLQYLLIEHNALCIRPYANLISNIGPEGAHSYSNHANIFQVYGSINNQLLTHPSIIEVDRVEDGKYWMKYSQDRRTEVLRWFLFKIKMYKFVKKIVNFYRGF